MVKRIDHLVIAVRDLALASADYQRAGFTVTPGGEHTSGGTRNALIAFADGAYFELLAFMEPDRPQAHRWWPRLARGEGLIDFALGAADLGFTADSLRARGLDVEGPTDGGRTTPDGQRLEWRTILPSDAVNTPLPFLIEDVTPRAWRVPGRAAAEHTLGVTRVDGVTVVVSDLEQSAREFAELIGTSGARDTSPIAGVRGAFRFPLGDQWIVLAEPDHSASEIRQHLEQRGAGPYEVVLGGAIASVGSGRLLPLGATHGARIRIARQGPDETMSESAIQVSRDATPPPPTDDRALSPSVREDEAYMRRCLEIARHALDDGDVPVGALVVRDGKVIGQGYERTHAALDPTAHAEVEALRDACRALGTLDLSGATLYTTVEPCVLCAFAARQARIGRVVFGVNAGALGGVNGPYPLLTDTTAIAGAAPPAVTSGVLAEDCGRLLAERRDRRIK